MKRQEYLIRAHEFCARGDDYKSSKLNPEKVRYIRKNPLGKTCKQLAEMFSVHYRTIEKVRHFETWAHIL